MREDVAWFPTRLAAITSGVVVAASVLVAVWAIESGLADLTDPSDATVILIALVGMPLVCLPPVFTIFPIAIGISETDVIVRFLGRRFVLPKSTILRVRTQGRLVREIHVETSGRRFWIPTRNLELARHLRQIRSG